MELVEQHERLFTIFPLETLRHHARRRLRDGAARPDKSHFSHRAILHAQVNFQLIAAKGIKAFGDTVGLFQLMEISRLLIVVEDDLLIQLTQF